MRARLSPSVYLRFMCNARRQCTSQANDGKDARGRVFSALATAYKETMEATRVSGARHSHKSGRTTLARFREQMREHVDDNSSGAFSFGCTYGEVPKVRMVHASLPKLCATGHHTVVR